MLVDNLVVLLARQLAQLRVLEDALAHEDFFLEVHNLLAQVVDDVVLDSLLLLVQLIGFVELVLLRLELVDEVFLLGKQHRLNVAQLCCFVFAQTRNDFKVVFNHVLLYLEYFFDFVQLFFGDLVNGEE